MTFHDNQFFSFEEIEKYKSLGLTVDGTKGGLLLGNLHKDDGIQMLFKHSDGYRLKGEVEGGEYLVNSEAAKLFNWELKYINNIERDEPIFSKRKVDLNNITILDCRIGNETFKSKLLLVDKFDFWCIINMYSTIGHLYRLENINYNFEKLFEKEEFDREAFKHITSRKAEKPKKNLLKRLFG
jgi:hypothetical protein